MAYSLKKGEQHRTIVPYSNHGDISSSRKSGSLYIWHVFPGDLNGDQNADLVCVQADGSVDIYQTHTSDSGIKFAPQPYVDSLFGFCPADQDEKARVANFMIYMHYDHK